MQLIALDSFNNTQTVGECLSTYLSLHVVEVQKNILWLGSLKLQQPYCRCPLHMKQDGFKIWSGSSGKPKPSSRYGMRNQDGPGRSLAIVLSNTSQRALSRESACPSQLRKDFSHISWNSHQIRC